MIGQTIGHYKIVEKLGAGGMGEVYRAIDTTLDREVALKLLPPDLAKSEERLDRFEREAKSLAALDHPNIVHIYTVEEVVVSRADVF
jgi:serine/threonine protein kinase